MLPITPFWHGRPAGNMCLSLESPRRGVRGKKGNVSVAATLLAVLLASDLDETQHDLSKLLGGYAVAGTKGVIVITTVADELGTQGDQQATSRPQDDQADVLFPNIRLSPGGNPGDDPDSFAGSRRDPVALLPSVNGEARGDILRYLGEISGEQYGTHIEVWQAWWRSRKTSFNFRQRLQRA